MTSSNVATRAAVFQLHSSAMVGITAETGRMKTAVSNITVINSSLNYLLYNVCKDD